MPANLLTWLLAVIVGALLLSGLFFAVWFIISRLQYFRYRRVFWKLQSRAALDEIGFWEIQDIPEPLDPLAGIESLRTVLQTISLAHRMGLFKYLQDNPGATAQQIAQFLGFALRQVRAALEVLTAYGALQVEQGGYVVTNAARLYLKEDSPFFQPFPPLIFPRRFMRSLRTGVVHGTIENWGRGKAVAPADWAIQQHNYSFPLGFALHKSGMLQGVIRILDVAGGAGSVCVALALSNPAIEPYLLELPGCIPVAEKLLSRYGLSERINCIAQDMFVGDWPAEFDAITFFNVFHNWDDERCHKLAQKAFQALRPGGRIFIIEALLHDTQPGPLWTAHWSMAMALLMYGRQFRFSELSAFLGNAGFIGVDTQPLLGHYSCVFGSKPVPSHGATVNAEDEPGQARAE